MCLYVFVLERDTFLTMIGFLMIMGRPTFSKTQQKEIALQRIKILFREAATAFSLDRSSAHRYVALARKIAMKVKTKIPLELKRRYCKHCYHYLQPGVNARVRTRKGKVVISCLDCKKFLRIPLK